MTSPPKMKSKIIAALLLTSAAAFAADTTRLGLQLWSLRNQLTASLPAGMAEVKALGFTMVESAGTYGHTAKEFRALADANGLKIVGAHIPYERMVSDLPGVIAEAKTLGAKYVIVAWVPHNTAFDVDQARAAVANFNLWGAALKAEGLGFGFHTHGYEFKPLADGTSAFDVMLNETKPELVFCEMDVFWVVQAGIDPVKLLEKYPGRFKAFHIKERQTVEFRAAAFNFLNHPLWQFTQGAIITPTFTTADKVNFASNLVNTLPKGTTQGTPDQKEGRRLGELSVKYNF